MIDIESIIFDECAKLVLAEYPKALLTSVNVAAPASFPAVSIIESDNSLDTNLCDSSKTELGAVVAYDVIVSSNLRTGAKKQAKKILSIVDEYLVAHNFNRTYVTRGESASDSSVYQMKARYMAGVTKDGKIYRR